MTAPRTSGWPDRLDLTPWPVERKLERLLRRYGASRAAWRQALAGDEGGAKLRASAVQPGCRSDR